MDGGGARGDVFASEPHQCHIEQLMSLRACCVPRTLPGAVHVLSHLVLRRRSLRDEKLVPTEAVHLAVVELGFASLLPASPISVQEEVIQKPQKLQCLPSAGAEGHKGPQCWWILAPLCCSCLHFLICEHIC